MAASDIESAIFSKLSSSSELVAVVASRIYPQWLDQETDYPALSFFRVDTPRLVALDGPVKLATPRFQFDIFTLKYADLAAGAKALRDSLDGFSGTADGFLISYAKLTDERDEPFEPETKTYRRILDFEIWHYE